MPTSTSKSPGKILKGALLLLAMFIGIFIVIPFLMSLLGFYPNGIGWKVAKEIVEKNGKANDCKKIIHLISQPLSPTEGEQRSNCIYEYAKLTKDPSACELLMPSSYGWSCLGGAQATADACSVDYGKEVSWLTGPDIYRDWATATMDECTRGTVVGQKGKSCCYILRLTSEPGVDDCSRFENDEPLMNFCMSQLAMKKGDPNLCVSIADQNKRVICELQAKYKN